MNAVIDIGPARIVPDYPGILPHDATKEEWSAMGSRIYRDAEGLTWHLADWAAHGERKWGALKEFCEMHEINYSTMSHYSSVALSVDCCRRRQTLSFSHHAEVAPLSPADQEKFLRKADENHWPVVELRRQIRAANGNKNALASDGAVTRTIGTKYDEVKNYLFQQPEAFWNEGTREIWKTRLRPLVEFYQKL